MPNPQLPRNFHQPREHKTLDNPNPDFAHVMFSSWWGQILSRRRGIQKTLAALGGGGVYVWWSRFLPNRSHGTHHYDDFFFFRCLLWLITGLVFIGEDSWTLTDIVASLNNPWKTLDWFLLKAIGSFYFSRFYKEPYTTVPEIAAKCIITTAIFWQYIDLIPWIAAITWCFFFFYLS